MRSLAALAAVFLLLVSGPVAAQRPPASPPPAQPSSSSAAAAPTVPDSSRAASSAAPQVIPAVAPPLSVESPALRQDQLATVAGGVASQDTPAAGNRSESSRQVKAVVGSVIDALFDMNGVAFLGLVAVIAMLCFYAFEDRSPHFILAFALATWTGSACAFLLWPWPFGVVGTVWGFIALRKWWLKTNSKNGGGKGGRPLLWLTRAAYILAIACAVILLIVDSPLAKYLSIPVSRSLAEAAPLLLVGIAFLGWLAISRPATLDFIKQALIAAAFILWGIDLLLPSGPLATFIGAVVISIYVGDLAWLMEGNLREKFGMNAPEAIFGHTSTAHRSAGICQCCGTSVPIRSGDRTPSS